MSQVKVERLPIKLKVEAVAVECEVSLLAFLVFYSFYSRGIYKYYFASVTPLLASLTKGKRQIYTFIAFNVLVLFVPRYLTPLPALITLVWMIRKPLLKLQSSILHPSFK